MSSLWSPPWLNSQDPNLAPLLNVDRLEVEVRRHDPSILDPLPSLPDGVLDLAAGDPVEDNPLPRGAGVGDPGHYLR